MSVAKFSAAAWVQATVAWNSEAGLPMLYKKTYKGTTNWGAWHYTGPLPLKHADVFGAALIRVVFGAMHPSGVWVPRDEFRVPPAPPPQPALAWVGDGPPAAKKPRNKMPRQPQA